ncbi:potassium transporter Kup [Sphingomonas glacialis]|uniref:potassium transporter Kup n=1 Tax=Sphingomonas glacialis TaxID=658225 RepID=UPI001E294F3D|nr:KUP/HAK/KT family potassium transporter [Sphingomonas glacialis]
MAALGIVYGDIGTSPLYAFKAAVHAALGSHGGNVGVAATGVASLVIWSLILVVSIKYALLIMRADNHGEGGVVAMLALLNTRDAPAGSRRAALLVLGLVGAALLYGDGAITPAISVLSAVEGLKTAAPGLAHFVLPITVVILIGLFAVQSRGTGFIGRIFGPVMLSWFVTIAVLGIGSIVQAPQVLVALSPIPAIGFLFHAPPVESFAVLGAVFLAVTGGEAMYADMGHFGRTPVRLAWFAVALPAIVLNYLGQAALLTLEPGQIDNAFYGLAPGWAQYPMIAFATVATVIASQAIISGVFSLTQQSIQLGFLPRLSVTHTAREESGQVYVALANWLLALATLSAVLTFRSSDALAGAYGIAVSGLMAISTFLAALVAIRWGYSVVLVVMVNGALMLLDLVFFSSNATKLLEGGWFPLVIAGVVAFLMLTWRRGIGFVEQARVGLRESEDRFVAMLEQQEIARVPGVAAFLSASTTGIPLALATHVRHNKSLQKSVLLVSVVTEEIPTMPIERRAEALALAAGFWRVILHFGFMEDLDIPTRLRDARTDIDDADLESISYYIGHETLVADRDIAGMWPWREALFVWMQRNATPTGASFGIASRQLIEIGTEIRI